MYQIAIVVYHFTIAAYSIFSSFITLNVIKMGETRLLCDLVSLTLYEGNNFIPFWTNSKWATFKFKHLKFDSHDAPRIFFFRGRNIFP